MCPEVDWAVADRLVRVVKTGRIDHKRQITVSFGGDHLGKQKTAVPLESTNVQSPSSTLVQSLLPRLSTSSAHSRWRIDAEVFQTITTDCHLKHPASTRAAPSLCSR
jgi:hypothetical protein